MPEHTPHRFPFRTFHRCVFTTVIVGVTLLAVTLVGQTPPNDVQALLQRQTQELMDAVAAGDHGPWTRYLHDQVIYAAEDGSTKTKAQLLEELRPLPKSVWGKLRVTKFRAVVHGSTAVTNYVADEDEGVLRTDDSRALSRDRYLAAVTRWLASRGYTGDRAAGRSTRHHAAGIEAR